MDQQYIERFMQKVPIGPKHQCWIWLGNVDRDGYGRVTPKKGWGDRAHRISAKIAGMNIEGMCVCHTCDNTSCVNPAHLFVATVGENNKDRSKKGRTRNGSLPKLKDRYNNKVT